MEATTELKQSQSNFPAKFLFCTSVEQMSQLDDLTNSFDGVSRMAVARYALSIGIAYLQKTGHAPLTASAVGDVATKLAGDCIAAA